LIDQQAVSCPPYYGHTLVQRIVIPSVGKVLQWQNPAAYRVSGVRLHLRRTPGSTV